MYASLQSVAIASRDQTVTPDLQSPRQKRDFLEFLSIEERSLYKRIPDEPDYISHPSFGSMDAEENLFSEESKINIPRWTYIDGMTEKIAPRTAKPATLSREDEATLFLRYNYARYQLRKLVDLQSHKCTPGKAQQMVHWFRRVLKVRGNLVEANMPLVLVMAKYTNVVNVEFSELISEGSPGTQTFPHGLCTGRPRTSSACRSVVGQAVPADPP